MRAPVCAAAGRTAWRAASTVAPASPSRAERVKVMSRQRDLESLPGSPDIGGTSIQGHARRLGKSRAREGSRGVAFLARLQRMCDVASRLPRTVFQAQQPDLAVGPEHRAVTGSKAEGLQVGQGVVADNGATQRIGDETSLAAGLGDQYGARFLQPPARALLRHA